MPLRNTNIEYGNLAKLLHWLVAIGIFALIWLGLQQSDMESGPARQAVRDLHGSIALVVFVLMTVRLVWRWMNAMPAHPEGLPAWQNAAAHLVHWGLYVAIFVQLLAGMLVVSSGGRPLAFFGLFSIPLPVAENHDFHELMEEVHEVIWVVIAVLVAVHMAAALYHHFIAKNDVLRRMTSGVRNSA